MSVPASYNWDQAEVLWLWPPRAFEAVGIPAGTVRRWVSEGHLEVAGRGPKNCNLYHYDDVIRHAERVGWRPRQSVRIPLDSGRGMSSAGLDVV